MLLIYDGKGKGKVIHPLIIYNVKT